jgi:hypothetical protein
MRLTKEKIKEVLEAGKSIRGAWSSAQLRLLVDETFKGAFPYPGWKDRLIGKEISQAKIDRFISLKNKHLSSEKIAEEKKARIEDYKTLFAGTNKYNCETCFHRKSCDKAWDKSTCCGYWYNPNSNIQGIAYEHKTEEMPLFAGIA